MALDRLIAARAGALFASDLSSRYHPDGAAVAAAVRNAVRAHRGARGCAGVVAAAYGDYPETAASRMRWARQVIEAIYCDGAVRDGSNRPEGIKPRRDDSEVLNQRRGRSSA